MVLSPVWSLNNGLKVFPELAEKLPVLILMLQIWRDFIFPEWVEKLNFSY